MPNSDQSALRANLVSAQNAWQSASSTAAAGVALIDQHFAAGAVPLTRAALVAAKAEADARLAAITQLAGVAAESEDLA